MEKLWIICSKYRKFEKPKTLYFFRKTIVLSIICSQCKNDEEKTIKEKESIKILRFLGLHEKYRGNKKLIPWRNRAKWIDN